MNKHAQPLFPHEPATPGTLPADQEFNPERALKLGNLAIAINNCAQSWTDKSIELGDLLKAAKDEFGDDNAGWNAWLKQEIKLGKTRIRDLLRIANSDDKRNEAMGLRKQQAARVSKHRKRNRRHFDIIDREQFTEWVYLCSPEALIEIFSEAKRLYPLGSESAVHYEVYMRAHILKHGDLDIVSVARALHVDRIKAEQMLNFAVSKEWILCVADEQWKHLPQPVRPRTLLEFLVSIGGIKDYSGELKARNLSHIRVRAFGPLVNNKSGMTLDHAREAAVEAGYLHDIGSWSGLPHESTVNDLLDAIDAETGGNFYNSSIDEVEAADYKAYQKMQNQIDDYGVDYYAIGEKFGFGISDYMKAHQKKLGDTKVLLRAKELHKGKYSVEDAIDQADAELNSPSTDELLDNETIAELKTMDWPPKDQPAVLSMPSTVETASAKIE